MPLTWEAEDLKNAVETMQNGGIILYPTDTVWGIGCDARNAEAVAKVYALKRRSDTKSMLVLLDAPGRLNYYVEQVPDMAWDLMEFSTRPLTIIYPKAREVARNLIAEDGSLGIRITKDPFCQRMCAMLKGPVVSTSANISGETTPTVFSKISKEIIDGVDYVVKYRQNDTAAAKPSSIIKLEINNVFELIR